MLKRRVLVTLLSTLLVFLIILLFGVDNSSNSMLTRMIKISSDKSSYYVDNNMTIVEVDTSKEQSLDEKEKSNSTQKKKKEKTNTVTNMSNKSLANLNVAKAVRSKKAYDGLTMEELASKLDRSLKNELSGKGYLYASYSLEKGVDPYLAVAISLEETGCTWNCSKLVKSCNNVGGMKGSGCGSYGAFPTLDDGIRAFIDNIYRNYVAYGLTTADTMNPKYAENPMWSTNVNAYITKIKNN